MSDVRPADPLLDELRTHGDPELDALVEQAAHSVDVGKLLQHITRRRGLNPLEMNALRQEGLMDDGLHAFFESRHAVPDWVDAEMIFRGGHLFRRHGMLCLLVLACASLPACYVWSRVADTLGFTGRLKTDVPRRIPETAQMVLDVETDQRLVPEPGTGASGLNAVNKVRLMHSLIRYFLHLNERPPPPVQTDNRFVSTLLDTAWDPTDGAAISQEHLGAVLLTFHVVVLRGIEALSLELSDADVGAYLYRWNVIGLMLGVDPQLLERMTTLEHAGALFELMMARNRHRTEAGIRLQAALLTYMRNNVIARVPGGRLHPAKHVPALMTRHLAGRTTSDALNLHLNLEERLLDPIIWGTMRAVGWLDNFQATSWLPNVVFRYIAKNAWALRTSDGTAGADTRGIMVPPELAAIWKL